MSGSCDGVRLSSAGCGLSVPARPALPAYLPSSRCRCARDRLRCSPAPPDERDYASKSRRRAGGEGRRSSRPATTRPQGEARASSCRSPTSRSIRTTTCRRRSSRSTTRPSIEMPTSTGANRKMRRVGTLEFTLKGQPLKLTAFNELGTDPGSPVRAVQRSDQRHRDLRGGTLHGSRSERHRHLRARLQPRLHPVLLLQPDATSVRSRRAKTG